MSVAADLASLRAVVGTGPADSELASLLTMHNQSVQAALNAYYEAPSPAVFAPAPAAPSNDCDTWPADQLERFVGGMAVQAYSYVSQTAADPRIRSGDALEPVWSGGASGSTSAPARGGKRRGPAPADEALRLCRTGDACRETLGRIPADVAKFLRPLLAAGAVRVQIDVRAVPPSLAVGHAFTVHVDVWLSRAALTPRVHALLACSPRREEGGPRQSR